MTHEQEVATQSMLRLRAAIVRMRDEAIEAKALHIHLLSDEQKNMVESCCKFAFADAYPAILDDFKSGDGTYWKFDKFLVQQPQK